jgi:hypothetical protein
MVFTYDQDQVNAALVCKAPEDAPCRTLPDCDCESYSMPEQDGQGWFHTASNPEFDITDPDSEEEVQHRHSPGRDLQPGELDQRRVALRVRWAIPEL